MKVVHPGAAAQTVLYTVDKNDKHRVVSVELQGNKYFARTC